MSSPPTTPTTSLTISPSGSTSSSATPSQTNGSNGNGGPSSSLYLFTFLATLFLLLFVSSAIILRSFILRRRFRRRIEEAILAGVIPPPRTGRSSRRRAIGEKPKLWEARVYPASDDRWDAIVPVAAQSTPMSGEHARTTTANMMSGETQQAEPVLAPLAPNSSRAPYRRQWLPNLFSWRRRASSPSSLSPMDPPILEPFEDPHSSRLQGHNLPSSSQDRLRVTVLIAMPDPRRPHADGAVFAGQSKGKERSLDLDYDEDDLPEMALGLTTELQYNDTVMITGPKLS